MDFIDLKTQLDAIRPKITKRISQVLSHGQFIMGPEVFELEERLSHYTETKHCITCANGTDALQLALMSLGVGRGDVVFTTAFSFFATAEVISLVGATPFFVDTDEHTFNICPNSLQQGIDWCSSKKIGQPKAVIAVDIFGLLADYTNIQSLCKKHNLFLIEDAAQSFGATYQGRKAGSFGDIATTSFFPAKPLGCYGDGGAIFTDNDELADMCRSLRVHGKGQHKYENIRVGLNSRLDTLQAAILLEKLNVFDEELTLRNRIAAHYMSQIPSHFNQQTIPEHYVSAWAQYSICCANENTRDNLIKHLSNQGIPANVYYPTPLNEQPALRNSSGVATPVCKKISSTILSLPMHPYLSNDDLDEICAAIVLYTPQNT